jgi:hypothetical protein
MSALDRGRLAEPRRQPTPSQPPTSPIGARTASAAWQSDTPLANCSTSTSTSTSASRAGETAGRPRVVNSPANCVSSTAHRARHGGSPGIPSGTPPARPAPCPQGPHGRLVATSSSLAASGVRCAPLRASGLSRSPSPMTRKFASRVLSVVTSAGVTLVAPIARSKNRRGAEAVVLSDHTIRLPLLSRSTGEIEGAIERCTTFLMPSGRRLPPLR